MAAAEILGRVVDADGEPVAGATVLFTSAPGPVPDIAALSGADGRFALDAPQPGHYVIAVRDAAGRSAQAEVDVGAVSPDVPPDVSPDVSPEEVEVRIG
jgi:hypothetical protein